MWAHYADHCQGVCLILDAEKFNNGLQTGGYEVKYAEKRRTMPLWFYSAYKNVLGINKLPGREEMHEILYKCYLDLLTAKSPMWKYEGEVRMIYDLTRPDFCAGIDKTTMPCPICGSICRGKEDCEGPIHRDTVSVPPEAVLGVIFGSDCPENLTAPILKLLEQPKYANVKTYWASLHASDYLIHYLEVSRADMASYQHSHTERIASAKDHIVYTPRGSWYPPYAGQKRITFDAKIPRGPQTNRVLKAVSQATGWLSRFSGMLSKKLWRISNRLGRCDPKPLPGRKSRQGSERGNRPASTGQRRPS